MQLKYEIMNLSDKVSVTVHSLLYILDKIEGGADFHKVFKILYFAERKHLSRYGSLITENEYVAMNNGPVPSMAYDILKSLRGSGLMVKYRDSFSPYFELTGEYHVKAKVKADLDEFSKSELLCLDESIEENLSKSFLTLTDESHDYAWSSANRNCEMSVFKIAKSGGANHEMIGYIKDTMELNSLSFS